MKNIMWLTTWWCYRERKDLKAQLVETVFRDLWVCQDLEDLLDHLERTETRWVCCSSPGKLSQLRSELDFLSSLYLPATLNAQRRICLTEFASISRSLKHKPASLLLCTLLFKQTEEEEGGSDGMCESDPLIFRGIECLHVPSENICREDHQCRYSEDNLSCFEEGLSS